MSQYERDTIAAHQKYVDLFAAPHRSPVEQVNASNAFAAELAPVMPTDLSAMEHWWWLETEAKAVLEVDGAL